MEDQKVLKAFIDDSVRDSIQQMKDSISKDLAEFRLMLLDILGKKATTSFEPRKTVMEAKLGQFCGENPEAWIVQAEHYFDFYKIKKDQKLTVASFYLDGEALKWYQWLFRNNQLIDWPHFADKVRIRFKQKRFESTGGRLANLGQVTYVTEYQNLSNDISSGLGEADDRASCFVYAYPQGSNITNSPLLQYRDEQSEGNNKTHACKVFDERLTNCCPTLFAETQSDAPIEMPVEEIINTESIGAQLFDGRPQMEQSARYKVLNHLGLSGKPIALLVPPNKLVNSVSLIIEVNGCANDAKNEDKNDEEEIVAIKDKPMEFVVANTYRPSLWINSIVFIPCDLAMFDIHKVLDDCCNQLFVEHSGKVYSQQGLELVQRREEIPSIPSTCSYAKLISKGISDHLSIIDHAAVVLALPQVWPEQFELGFPFDPGSSSLTTFFGVIRNCVYWGVLGSCNNSRLMTLTKRNSCIAPFELWFRNINSVCDCILLEVVDDGRNYASYFIICSLDMLPARAECHDYGLMCLVSQSNSATYSVILHVWDPGIHRQPMKLNHLNNNITEDEASGFPNKVRSELPQYQSGREGGQNVRTISCETPPPNESTSLLLSSFGVHSVHSMSTLFLSEFVDPDKLMEAITAAKYRRMVVVGGEYGDCEFLNELGLFAMDEETVKHFRINTRVFYSSFRWPCFIGCVHKVARALIGDPNFSWAVIFKEFVLKDLDKAEDKVFPFFTNIYLLVDDISTIDSIIGWNARSALLEARMHSAHRHQPQDCKLVQNGNNIEMVITTSNVRLAPFFRKENLFLEKGSSNTLVPGSFPFYILPDLLKIATNMMGDMYPEEVQNIFARESSLKEQSFVMLLVKAGQEVK